MSDAAPDAEPAAEDDLGAEPIWPATRTGVLRDAAGVGLATGAYGLSFGAISSAAGLSVLQTCVLSLVMFTGGSQFAMVGVIGGGGAAMTGAATAIMLGVRNAFYAVRMASILDVGGWRRPVAAQLTIDESTAMAVARTTVRSSRLAFWATGASVYVFWNLATLIGALSAHALSNPRVLGLDAAAPAAFLALMSPRLRSREPWIVALTAAVVALVSVPFVPTGVPVLFAAGVAVIAGLRPAPDTGRRNSPRTSPGGSPERGSG
ncbi:MAG TPA: AzlC family ABC transporter permease [Acidothermaceae bacterium]|jgi:predicted branched-subunit amino acid permease